MGDLDRINVHLTNNEGGGFSEQKQVTANTTISQFIGVEVTNDPSKYTIRVNSREVHGDYILRNGDRITVTPLKVAGA